MWSSLLNMTRPWRYEQGGYLLLLQSEPAMLVEVQSDAFRTSGHGLAKAVTLLHV
jgi:hypothetical protein